MDLIFNLGERKATFSAGDCNFASQLSVYNAITRNHPEAQLEQAVLKQDDRYKDVTTQFMELVERRKAGEYIPNYVSYKGLWSRMEAEA